MAMPWHYNPLKYLSGLNKVPFYTIIREIYVDHEKPTSNYQPIEG